MRRPPVNATAVGQSRQRRTLAQHDPPWFESGRRGGVEVALARTRNVAEAVAARRRPEWVDAIVRTAAGRSTVAGPNEQRRFSGSGGHCVANRWTGRWVLSPRACDPRIDVVVLQRSRDGNPVAPVDDVIAVRLSA